jgi:hypothetical protein
MKLLARTGALLAAAGLAGSISILTSSTARADDICSGAWCAHVSNFTNNHMLVAAIGRTGSAGGTSGTCYFLAHGTLDCRTKTQPVGTTSNSSTYADPDGFTFTGTGFYYNGVHFNKNQYVRVWDYELIVCSKVPPLEPRCVG